LNFHQAISDSIIFLCENSITKRVIRFLHRLLSSRNDIKVRLYGQTIYASTLDRIVVLYLKKLALVEAFETEFFRSIVKKGMTVIDVGANLGWYSLMAANLVGKEGRVFAFEPDPENFRLLSKNIQVNGHQNIKVINQAVSDKTGAGQLFLCEENRGDHRIYNPNNERRGIEISTTSLDDFFQDSPHIDVIKIDVQGAEHLVFSGMDQIIKTNAQLFIMMELCPKFLKMCGSSPRDFLKTIENYGFLIYFINEDKKKLEPINDKKSVEKCLKQKSVNLFLKKTIA